MSGWLLLLGFAAGLGALITGPLADTGFVNWDENYPVDLEAARTSTGESWSQVGSGMGETLTVVGVAVAIGIVFLIARRWASALLLATALLAEVSVFVVTTILIPRDRPDVEQLDVSPPTSSFPSGHTAAATALALTLALLVGWNTRSMVARWLAWVLAVLVGPVVAFSRVYRGMHHPTDVVVGLVIGAACATLAFFAVRAWVGSSGNRDGVRGSHSIEETVR
ncbi:MAG: phosphatase PAP2 family protein [Actinomycetia bacterium]|nr:phosphatase PAP2 family protein [Actinomycetes bacterium]